MASINKGDNTAAFGCDFLRIYLNNPNKLEIQRAVFQVNGQLEKEFYEPKFPLRVNFTGEETELLKDINKCKLALWDEHGRRRTADGTFTFFVKQNCIKQVDTPDGYEGEEVEEDNSIYFTLDDADFAAKFTINATPSKMSELEMDIPIMTFDKIIAGDNIHTVIDENDNLIISADLDTDIYWNEIKDKPSINGIPLDGDITISTEQVNADWNATSGVSQILNKPTFSSVAYTGYYNDLVNKPDIPSKTSELENDSKFITKDVDDLSNYMTKEETQTKIDSGEFLEPINERIDNLTIKHEEDILLLDNKLNLKANEEDTQNKLNLKADLEYVEDELSIKLDSKKLGSGILTINENGNELCQFSANAAKDETIDITIPTKVSELTNDVNYIKKDEINLDLYLTKSEFESKEVATLDDIGTGILTLKTNNESIGTFNANTKSNKSINIEIPTKLSELEQDVNYASPNDLNLINTEITELQTEVHNIPAQINALQVELDNKVDVEAGKTMISTSELDRLSKLEEYDDTEVRTLIETNKDDISQLKVDVSNKVEIIDGKGLSSNDFTDTDKYNLDNAVQITQDVDSRFSQLHKSIQTNATNIQTNTTNISDLTNKLTSEITERESQDNYLQSQIDGLTAKSTVVDIVASEQDLEDYDTSNLEDKDVICVLKDETKNDTTSYYRWNGATFLFVGSEGEYYTKADASDIFVKKTRTINGHELSKDITLTASDVDALPTDTLIGDGTVTIQRNGTSLGTFTLNQEENKAIDISVPEAISELDNDLNFVSEKTMFTYIGDVTTDNNLQDQVDAIKEQEETNSNQIETLKELITGEIGGLPAVALSGSYNDLTDKPTIPSKVSELTNDSGYITASEVESGYVKPEDLPTKISEFENDRGYVTNSAIGRGVLTLQVNGTDYATWMANEKDDQTANMPVDSELSTTSILPVQNNTVTTELQRIDNTTLHKTGDETSSGTKTFATIKVNTISITNGTSTTVATSDNSTNLATTAFVKNQDYCTNTDAVHKAQTETITGNKTFSGTTKLSTATGVTVISSDNSTNLATTAFVKNQDYATNSVAVHKTGDETIQGDKTFNDTIIFNGIVQLSKYSHVPTPDLTDASNEYTDLVTNVEFVQDVQADINTRIDNEVATLNSTISDEVSTLNTTINNKETSLNTKISTNATNISTNKTNIETNAKSISTLQSNLNTTNTNVTTNANNIKTLQNDVTTIKSNYRTKDEIAADIKVVADDLSEFETKVANTYVTSTDFESFKTTLEARLVSIEDRLTALEG